MLVATPPVPVPSTGVTGPVQVVLGESGRALAQWEGFDGSRLTGRDVSDPATGAWERVPDLPGIGWGAARMASAGGDRIVVAAAQRVARGRFNRGVLRIVAASGDTSGRLGRWRQVGPRGSREPALAAAPQGRVVVAYTDARGRVVVRERVRARWGDAHVVGRGFAPAVAVREGRRVVAYGCGAAVCAAVARRGHGYGRPRRLGPARDGSLALGAAVTPSGRAVAGWATRRIAEGRPLRTTVRVAVARPGRPWRRRTLARWTAAAAPVGRGAVVLADGRLVYDGPAATVTVQSPGGPAAGVSRPGAALTAAAGSENGAAAVWTSPAGGVEASRTAAGGWQPPVRLDEPGERIVDIAGIAPRYGSGQAVVVRGRVEPGATRAVLVAQTVSELVAAPPPPPLPPRRAP